MKENEKEWKRTIKNGKQDDVPSRAITSSVVALAIIGEQQHDVRNSDALCRSNVPQ